MTFFTSYYAWVFSQNTIRERQTDRQTVAQPCHISQEIVLYSKQITLIGIGQHFL